MHGDGFAEPTDPTELFQHNDILVTAFSEVVGGEQARGSRTNYCDSWISIFVQVNPLTSANIKPEYTDPTIHRDIMLMFITKRNKPLSRNTSRTSTALAV